MTSSRTASWSFLLETASGVLGGDHHGVDARHLAVPVLDAHLGLAVGTQEVEAAAAGAGQLAGEVVRVLDGRRHQLGRLVAGVAEHHPLVAGAAGVDPLPDVGRLLVDRHQHRAGVAVEAHVAAGVADPLHRLAGQLLVVDWRLGGDLAGDHDVAGLEQRLAGHPPLGIAGQDGVEDGVGDLVGHLVRMAFGHRLGGEEEVFLHGSPGKGRPRYVRWNGRVKDGGAGRMARRKRHPAASAAHRPDRGRRPRAGRGSAGSSRRGPRARCRRRC